MEGLKTSLELYHINNLKEIAQQLGLSHKTNTRKTWLVNELKRTIIRLAKSRDYVAELNEAERAILGIALKNGDAITLREIALPLILADLVYVEGVTQSSARPTVEEVLRSLLKTGLLVNLTEPEGSSSRRTFDHAMKFGIPPEIRSTLPTDLLKIPQSSLSNKVIEQPARVETVDFENYLRKLFFFWAELRRDSAKKLKSGGMAKRDRRRIANGLGLDVDEDEAQLYEMYSRLQALSLVTDTDTRIEAVDDEVALQFWGSSLSAQFQDILKLYTQKMDAVSIDSSQIMRYSYYASFSLQPSTVLRQKVLSILSEIAEVGWFPLSLMTTFLNQGSAGLFILDEKSLNNLYRGLRWYGTRDKAALGRTIKKVEREAILSILRELHNLGAIELGYNEQDSHPVAVHLTPLTQTYFKNKVGPKREKEWQVILQPDFQVLAMGPVSLRMLSNLELVAEREKWTERVSTYRITRESVYQTLQRGNSVSVIQATLESATGEPLPQNVARTLEEWGRLYERIVLRREVAIMQVDSAELLEQLLADHIIKKHVHPLDAHTAWYHQSVAKRVRQRLWELEHLPAYSRGPEADLPHSLRWDGDSLRARHPMPSLYVTGTIRRLAEHQDGHWRLTPESIQSAVSTGFEIPAVITLLEEMTGTQLSSDWEKQLKAWGNHYGDGKLSRVLLLRLKSAEALTDLRRADRRLHRWLQPLPKTTGLAIVNEKHAEEVKNLLSEWGIEVQESD